MTKTVTLTLGTDSTSGPFPPTYPAGAIGYIAAASTPDGSSAGAISSNLYFGATIVALANDSAHTQLILSLLGNFDQSFIGDVTANGQTYDPANATFVIYQLNGSYVTSWIWASLAPLVTGTVTIGDTGDTLVQLQAAAPSSTEIALTWVNIGPTPPVNYELYRGIASAAPTLYQTLANTLLAYNDTGLTPNQQYTYYVVATYADGTNAASIEIVAFTPASGISNTFNCNCEVLVPDGWTIDTLGNMRKNILALAGYAAQAANPPPGMKLFVNTILADSQKQLYRQHVQYRIKRMYAWQMEINQRYYSLTQDESGCRRLDPLSVEWVGFEDLNQAWYILVNGIDPVLYTRAQISTGWPTHYEIRSCIEIFPAPRAPYTLWIKGQFGLDPFAADTDTTTVDAEAVFLLALGRVKLHYGNPDAQAVLTQASNYTKYLTAGQHNTRRYVPRTRVQTPWTPPKFLPLGEGS